MRNWCLSQRVADVIDVCAHGTPRTEQHNERSSYSSSEDQCEYLWRRLRIGAENVMDLLALSITKGRFRSDERAIGIELDVQVKRLMLVRRRAAEGSDDDRGFDGRARGQELVRKVLLRLWLRKLLVNSESRTLRTSSSLPFPVSLTLKGKDSSRPLAVSLSVRKT